MLSGLDSNLCDAKCIIPPQAASLSLNPTCFVQPFLFLQSSSSPPPCDTFPPFTWGEVYQDPACQGGNPNSFLPCSWICLWGQHGQDKLTLSTPAYCHLAMSIMWLVGGRLAVHEMTQNIFWRRALKLPVMRASMICGQLNLFGPCTGVLVHFVLHSCTENGRHLVKINFVCIWCICLA